MEHTLIAADRHWAIWTVLLGAAAFGYWAEHTRIGRRLSGCVVTMGATFLLSNLRVIPATGVPAYDVVWDYLVPLAIPLLLLRADLRRIIREAGPTLIAYLIGAVGTVIGTIVAYKVVPLGEAGWQLASIFSATYIGGSMNYAAAAKAVGLESGDLLSAGVAADNLVMALYFLVLFALPGIARLGPPTPTAGTRGRWSSGGLEAHAAFPTPARLAAAVALAFGLCAVGFVVAERLRLARRRHPGADGADGDPGHGPARAHAHARRRRHRGRLPHADLLRGDRRQRQRAGGDARGTGAVRVRRR